METLQQLIDGFFHLAHADAVEKRNAEKGAALAVAGGTG